MDVVLGLEAQDLRQLLRVRNNHNQTLLHSAASNPNPHALNQLLHFMNYYDLEWEACLKLLMDPDGNGDTVFHLAADKPNSLRAIMSFVEGQPGGSKDDAYEILTAEGQDGKTVSHAAANTPESVILLLNSAKNISETKLLKLFCGLDVRENTVWHIANGPSLEKLCAFMVGTHQNSAGEIINNLSEEGCKRVLNLRGKNNETVLEILQEKHPGILESNPRLQDIVNQLREQSPNRERFLSPSPSLSSSSDDDFSDLEDLGPPRIGKN